MPGQYVSQRRYYFACWLSPHDASLSFLNALSLDYFYLVRLSLTPYRFRMPSWNMRYKRYALLSDAMATDFVSGCAFSARWWCCWFSMSDDITRSLIILARHMMMPRVSIAFSSPPGARPTYDIHISLPSISSLLAYRTSAALYYA